MAEQEQHFQQRNPPIPWPEDGRKERGEESAEGRVHTTTETLKSRVRGKVLTVRNLTSIEPRN